MKNMETAKLCGAVVTDDGWHFHSCRRKAKWIVKQWDPVTGKDCDYKYRCGYHAKNKQDRIPIKNQDETS